MKNKLTDLNNHLFAQLERLGDEDLKGENLTAELGRARAVSQVAGNVIDLGRLAVDSEKTKRELGLSENPVQAISHDKTA